MEGLGLTKPLLCEVFADILVGKCLIVMEAEGCWSWLSSLFVPQKALIWSAAPLSLLPVAILESGIKDDEGEPGHWFCRPAAHITRSVLSDNEPRQHWSQAWHSRIFGFQQELLDDPDYGTGCTQLCIIAQWSLGPGQFLVCTNDIIFHDPHCFRYDLPARNRVMKTLLSLWSWSIIFMSHLLDALNRYTTKWQ